MKLTDTLLPKAENKHENELIFTITNAFKKIKEIINGKISFTDNTDSEILTAEISDTDVAVSINHNLKREPEGLIMIGSVGGVVYIYTKTTNSIAVKATVAGQYKILIF